MMPGVGDTEVGMKFQFPTPSHSTQIERDHSLSLIQTEDKTILIAYERTQAPSTGWNDTTAPAVTSQEREDTYKSKISSIMASEESLGSKMRQVVSLTTETEREELVETTGTLFTQPPKNSRHCVGESPLCVFPLDMQGRTADWTREITVGNHCSFVKISTSGGEKQAKRQIHCVWDDCTDPNVTAVTIKFKAPRSTTRARR